MNLCVLLVDFEDIFTDKIRGKSRTREKKKCRLQSSHGVAQRTKAGRLCTFLNSSTFPFCDRQENRAACHYRGRDLVSFDLV